MHDDAATYLRQGIETFIALNGRIIGDEQAPHRSYLDFDARAGKVPVEVHDHSFREYPAVIVYDANLPSSEARVAIARQLVTLAPVYWPLVGRAFGNASERGQELDAIARVAATNGGRKDLDALLREHALDV